MNADRFFAWQLVRLRGRGPFTGSAWRVAAHIYRDRAINCMEAMRSFQQDIHTWEDAYSALEMETILLRELYDDLARWREAGGDIRDLTYVFETMDRIIASKGEGE